jgi:hypothetical protein
VHGIGAQGREKKKKKRRHNSSSRFSRRGSYSTATEDVKFFGKVRI